MYLPVYNAHFFLLKKPSNSGAYYTRILLFRNNKESKSAQIGGLGRKKSFLVYDSFEAHMTDTVKVSIKCKFPFPSRSTHRRPKRRKSFLVYNSFEAHVTDTVKASIKHKFPFSSHSTHRQPKLQL